MIINSKNPTDFENAYWNTHRVFEHMTEPEFKKAHSIVGKALGISQNDLFDEFWWCQSLINNSSSPIVFCHNDIHGGNIVQTDNKVHLIDFTEAGWGFRAFDIAYYFFCFDQWPNTGTVQFVPIDHIINLKI